MTTCVPLTADTTRYTADTVLLTADMTEICFQDTATTGGGRKRRHRYIMPDGRAIMATTAEAFDLLERYTVIKEAPRPAAKKTVSIKTPAIVLQKSDVRFVPAADASPDTYKAVISERFDFKPPADAYRQAEILANRLRDDDEAVIALLL